MMKIPTLWSAHLHPLDHTGPGPPVVFYCACRDVDVGHKTLQNVNFLKFHIQIIISTNTISNLMNNFCMNFVATPKIGA